MEHLTPRAVRAAKRSIMSPANVLDSIDIMDERDHDTCLPNQVIIENGNLYKARSSIRHIQGSDVMGKPSSITRKVREVISRFKICFCSKLRGSRKRSMYFLSIAAAFVMIALLLRGVLLLLAGEFSRSTFGISVMRSLAANFDRRVSVMESTIGDIVVRNNDFVESIDNMLRANKELKDRINLIVDQEAIARKAEVESLRVQFGQLYKFLTNLSHPEDHNVQLHWIQHDKVLRDVQSKLEVLEDSIDALASAGSRFDSEIENSILYKIRVMLEEDMTGRPDVALTSSGARIHDLDTSPTYWPYGSRLSLIFSGIGPDVAIQGSYNYIVDPNMCWPCKLENYCSLGVNLGRSVIVDAVSIDHAPRSISDPAGNTSPPKHFKILLRETVDGPLINVGEFEYKWDQGSPRTQMFKLKSNLRPSAVVVLYVTSRHFSDLRDKASTVCITRFRVHPVTKN